MRSVSCLMCLFTFAVASGAAEQPETETGRLQSNLPTASALAFSPDGSWLAACSGDQQELGLWDTTTGQLVRRWRDSTSAFLSAAFAPDGRTLSATCNNRTILLCDVTGPATAPGQLASEKLAPARIEQLWKELGSADAPRAHQALWTLVSASDQTVGILAQRLRPVDPEPKKLASLIAELDSDRYAVREKATQALEKMDIAKPALEAILSGELSLEMRRRVELILANLADLPWDSELVLQTRAVCVLEQIRSKQACDHLKALAKGAPGARLTQAAIASLERIAG